MRLSIYTSVRNAISMDFHAEHMLRHHLALADEIVVNEGYSDDDTYERLSCIDAKIRIVRNKWDRSRPEAWWRAFGEQARRLCTSEWCLKLDADEFVPEWEFSRLRQLLESAERSLYPIRMTNFYANYKVFNANPARSRLPETKWVIHRNRPDVRIVGDGANVVLDSEPWGEVPHDPIQVHHFGAVRDPARLRQKWRNDGAMKAKRPHFDKVPAFVYRLFPYNWFDEDFLDDLEPYEGPFVKAVAEDPDEFVRDGMAVYNWLIKRRSTGRA